MPLVRLDLGGVPDDVPLITRKRAGRQATGQENDTDEEDPNGNDDTNKKTRPRKRQKSNYVGVHWDGYYWRSTIRIQGHKYDLGRFAEETSAAREYAKARHKYSAPTEVYGGLDLSKIPKDLPLIPNNRNNSKSPYKGVTKNGNRWQAKIYVGSKCRALGTFDTAQEAAQIFARATAFLVSNPLSPINVYGHLDLSSVPKGLPPVYHGVEQNEKGQWTVNVTLENGNEQNLGTFCTAEQAAELNARALFYLNAKKEKKRCPKKVLYGGFDLSKVPTDVPLRLSKHGSACPYKGIRKNQNRWQA